MKIARKDLKGLIKYTEQVKTCIDEDRKDDAKHLINMLQKNIADHIKDKQLKVDDRVKVIDVIEDELYYKYEDFIGGEGFIVKIHDRKDYPYEIEFENEELQRKVEREGGLLWKEKELEAV